MDESPDPLDWRAALRRQRTRRKLSRAEVALRAQLSASAVKAYEQGYRKPSRAALDALIAAIGLSREEADPILGGAGFAIDWHSALDHRYLAEMEDLRRQADRTPWPVLITNQGSYVVHWNRALELLWEVDVEREYPDPLSRNLLALATTNRFTRCIANYEETMFFFFGLMKGDPRVPRSLEQPAPWHQDAVERLLDGDACELRRLLNTWEKAPAVPHKTRHQYRAVWRRQGVGAELRFIGQHSVCDVWNELSWQEWIPADNETWANINALG